MKQIVAWQKWFIHILSLCVLCFHIYYPQKYICYVYIKKPNSNIIHLYMKKKIISFSWECLIKFYSSSSFFIFISFLSIYFENVENLFLFFLFYYDRRKYAGYVVSFLPFSLSSVLSSSWWLVIISIVIDWMSLFTELGIIWLMWKVKTLIFTDKVSAERIYSHILVVKNSIWLWQHLEMESGSCIHK